MQLEFITVGGGVERVLVVEDRAGLRVVVCDELRGVVDRWTDLLLGGWTAPHPPVAAATRSAAVAAIAHAPIRERRGRYRLDGGCGEVVM